METVTTLPRGRELTRADLDAMPDDGHRYELIDGALVVTPARDRRELDRFARRTSGFQTIDGESVARLEPDLAGRFDRALFFPDEAHLDPRHALATLRGRLADQGVAVDPGPARTPRGTPRCGNAPGRKPRGAGPSVALG